MCGHRSVYIPYPNHVDGKLRFALFSHGVVFSRPRSTDTPIAPIVIHLYIMLEVLHELSPS